jgi:hypothetical protein
MITWSVDTSDELTGTYVTIEKKIAIMTAMEIFILGGIAAQLNTGSTKKSAEILVSTIAKPRSFSIIGSTNHYPIFWI